MMKLNLLKGREQRFLNISMKKDDDAHQSGSGINIGFEASKSGPGINIGISDGKLKGNGLNFSGRYAQHDGNGVNIGLGAVDQEGKGLNFSPMFARKLDAGINIGGLLATSGGENLNVSLGIATQSPERTHDQIISSYSPEKIGFNVGLIAAGKIDDGVNIGGLFSLHLGRGVQMGLVTYDPQKELNRGGVVPLINVRTDVYDKKFISRARAARASLEFLSAQELIDLSEQPLSLRSRCGYKTEGDMRILYAQKITKL